MSTKNFDGSFIFIRCFIAILTIKTKKKGNLIIARIKRNIFKNETFISIVYSMNQYFQTFIELNLALPLCFLHVS